MAEERKVKGKVPFYMQSVSNVLGQTSTLSFSRQNKAENSYTHILTNEWFLNLQMDYIKEWFLSLIERLPSTINPITMQYFTDDWHNTFIIHVFNLITFGYYCLSSHDSQWSKYSLDTSDRGLSHHFKGFVEVTNSWTGTANLFVTCLFIFNWSWMHLGS